jgi:hypothetical protein
VSHKKTVRIHVEIVSEPFVEGQCETRTFTGDTDKDNVAETLERVVDFVDQFVR